MKNKFDNEAKIEGYVYQSTLAIKTVQNKESANFGKEFINGKISVATDENCVNVVDVFYTYVTPTTKAGTANKTFTALKQIMEGPTVLSNGKESATKVSLKPSIALNDFYDAEGQLASPKRLEGGFVTIVNALNPHEELRNTFLCDIVMTSIRKVEADGDKVKKDYDEIRGAIFNFRNEMLPTEFRIDNPEGMAFFENIEPSKTNPVFTKIWGNVISQSVVETISEATAFGVPRVKEVTRSNKAYLISGTAEQPGQLDETTITSEELAKAVQDREVHLAEVKRRQDEYQASKNAAPTSAPVSAGSFNF